jgi:hypothetical protein
VERQSQGRANQLDRIRAVMHHFQGEQGERKSIAPSRKLWTALHALDGFSPARATGWSIMPSATVPV